MEKLSAYPPLIDQLRLVLRLLSQGRICENSGAIMNMSARAARF